MSYSSDQLLELLKAKGADAPTTEHEPVYTVEQSRLLRGEIPGTHTKNLFLRDAKKNYFLVVVNEDTDVDLKRLRGLIGARGNLSFASQEALREILGVEAGAVSAFAVINDEAKMVQIVLEESLLGSKRINAHPLVNHRTTSVTPEHLLRFLDDTGHRPVLVDAF
ncbi:MAG: prolyl-tRNA synthetase associated domain-containing protein [Vulcanimicrobiaceae bacterium]